MSTSETPSPEELLKNTQVMQAVLMKMLKDQQAAGEEADAEFNAQAAAITEQVEAAQKGMLASLTAPSNKQKMIEQILGGGDKKEDLFLQDKTVKELLGILRGNPMLVAKVLKFTKELLGKVQASLEEHLGKPGTGFGGLP